MAIDIRLLKEEIDFFPKMIRT